MSWFESKLTKRKMRLHDSRERGVSNKSALKGDGGLGRRRESEEDGRERKDALLSRRHRAKKENDFDDVGDWVDRSPVTRARIEVTLKELLVGAENGVASLDNPRQYGSVGVYGGISTATEEGASFFVRCGRLGSQP